VHTSFLPFGDISDLQLPKDPSNRMLPPPSPIPIHLSPDRSSKADKLPVAHSPPAGGPHKGFAFVTFNSAESALDAIDNMHRNTLPGPSNAGRPLKVNLAKPPKPSAKGGANRAVWDDEAWIKEHGTVAVEQREIGTEGTD